MSLRAAFHRLDGDDSSYIDFFEFLSFVQQNASKGAATISLPEICLLYTSPSPRDS